MQTIFSLRVVGGLLSAYDLSDDIVFLNKARDIADRLLPAWDSPSGIPYNFINLATGRAHNPSWTGVSCLFPLQHSASLEFFWAQSYVLRFSPCLLRHIKLFASLLISVINVMTTLIFDLRYYNLRHVLFIKVVIFDWRIMERDG